MNDEILFNIKEVASIVGVSPATIRNWERKDLFASRRDDNNYRIYHLKDVDYLKKIKEYSDQRLNAQAIKKLLENDVSIAYDGFTPLAGNTTSSDEVIYSKKLLSQKWKLAREQKQLTLDEVSNDTGISTSYLSRIENMNANISLDILNRLSEYYGESLIYFYGDDELADTLYVEKKDRDPIDIGLEGVYIESLIKRKNTVMRPAIYTVLPSSGQKRSHSHRGEEFIYIIQGEIAVILDTNEKFILKEGDSMNFPSSTSHYWYNDSNKICTLIWVHSPISAE